MSTPRALLLRAPGINCEGETGHAFEAAGGEAVPVHINELLDGSVRMTEFDAFLASGGFSYGDTIRSGAILGRLLRERFADDINSLIDRGVPIVGICNGFQVLVEAGVLPHGKIKDTPKQVSLIQNDSGEFKCRWTKVKVGESACKFLGADLSESIQSIPVAHGEGKFVAPEFDLPADQIVLQYVDSDGAVTTNYPDNPNGSPHGITGICDPSGVVLGMMPHPERALYQNQHENWRRGEGAHPFGMELFKGIVSHARSV